MPLHLLGKKSWNVYNPANIERVRRDEAQAKAQEEEDERLMQEADAERRIQILRGERPSTPPPPPPAPSARPQERKSHTEDAGRFRKRRRLAGEDDTDRDIRFAQEDAQLALDRRAQQAAARSSDAPLHDSTGHIDLFPSEAKRKPVEKNAEAEKETKEKKRELEDQYTMRFSNAAGFRQSVGQNPWYSSSHREGAAAESMPSKDVWGNEDPLRREREKARMDANDPLAAMRKGVRQLKTVEQERKKWNEERSRELEALKASEKHRSSHRSRRSPSQDSIEGFRLDASPDRRRDDKDGRSHRHHRHRRDRSRDRSHRRTSHSGSRSHRSHHDRHHRHRESRRHDEDSRSRR
ncbi:uncharacterized protein BO88DRAFT_23739 [Aspergillus vadensis CBS 113365]|uniref:CBF1-interacting co-repressor CIR N-terminal domain-containing protein n=1 Tax=Aspergillus vadensis (strain CBS 113365 / IMI 142717 / IBT 24658) TaxID=1448311 RepID=A0A319BNB2_ASPVC|nr:hypothetical protein BO88DRAFT_23739 [Aspergillus vadensis CBS 113365]PYH74826.1 hypothetical protein BO88DRAFT_23739 [Aspergillus vadensis CBS 113365]